MASLAMSLRWVSSQIATITVSAPTTRERAPEAKRMTAAPPTNASASSATLPTELGTGRAYVSGARFNGRPTLVSGKLSAMARTDRVRVGVLAPMKSELRPVVKAFALQRGEINGVAVHTGSVGNADIVATTTGIGTALATSRDRTAARLGRLRPGDGRGDRGGCRPERHDRRHRDPRGRGRRPERATSIGPRRSTAPRRAARS